MTYILFNPRANGGHGFAGVKKVQAAFQADAPQVLDITKLDTKEFLMGLPADDRVILCGGDGTINRMVNDLDGAVPAAPVYMWRFGTGNDFLRDVADVNASQTVLLNDYIKGLPYAEIDGRKYRFVNNCGCGVDGLVCQIGENAKRKRKKGKVNYSLLAIRAFLLDFRCTSARVTVDGETREYDDVWMATTMQGRFFGGGMKFAPDQDRTSGRLCCIVWHGAGRLTMLLRFASVFKGGHLKYKDMCDVRYGNDIVVELSDPQAVNLDGEVVDGVTRYIAHK